MKTAGEWISEYAIDKGRVLNKTTTERKLKFGNGDLVRAIQADALSEAVEIVRMTGSIEDIEGELRTRIQSLT